MISKMEWAITCAMRGLAVLRDHDPRGNVLSASAFLQRLRSIVSRVSDSYISNVAVPVHCLHVVDGAAPAAENQSACRCSACPDSCCSILTML